MLLDDFLTLVPLGSGKAKGSTSWPLVGLTISQAPSSTNPRWPTPRRKAP